MAGWLFAHSQARVGSMQVRNACYAIDAVQLTKHVVLHHVLCRCGSNRRVACQFVLVTVDASEPTVREGRGPGKAAGVLRAMLDQIPNLLHFPKRRAHTDSNAQWSL